MKYDINIMIARLKEAYPLALCELDADQPYRLLIATRLSAQCTDRRVNMVTPALFEAFPTLEAFAAAEPDDIEPYIRSCGLSKTKSRDIVFMCRQIIENYDGKLSDTVEELVKLSGVGRKTANLIVGDVYGKPAVVADTHVIRITNLLGLCNKKDPLTVENTLRVLLPPEESNDFCHRIVLHGRAVCVAGRPACDKCILSDMCKSAKR